MSPVAVWFHRLYNEQLGFTGASSHSGRRTFVTKAAHKIVQAGGSLRDIQQLAGHASLSTTQRYIEGNSNAKRRVVDIVHGHVRELVPPVSREHVIVLAELPHLLDKGERGVGQWHAVLAVPLVAPEGEFIIYSPGSVVSIMNNGVLFERKLTGPQLVPFGGTSMLVYSYDTGGRGTGMIPHDQVQATGHEWSLSYWDPITNEMRPVDEEGTF